MLPKEDFKTILERLVDKSRANQVRWQHALSNTFQVPFPGGATLSVSAGTPEDEPDWAGAFIRIGDELIARFTANDGDDDYPFLRSVYDEAYRRFVGVDEAIKRMKMSLNSDDTIGETGIPPDDIPF